MVRPELLLTAVEHSRWRMSGPRGVVAVAFSKLLQRRVFVKGTGIEQRGSVISSWAYRPVLSAVSTTRFTIALFPSCPRKMLHKQRNRTAYDGSRE